MRNTRNTQNILSILRCLALSIPCLCLLACSRTTSPDGKVQTFHAENPFGSRVTMETVVVDGNRNLKIEAVGGVGVNIGDTLDATYTFEDGTGQKFSISLNGKTDHNTKNQTTMFARVTTFLAGVFARPAAGAIAP